MKPPFYAIATYLLGLTLRVGTRFQVEGKENVPPFGPLLVVSNHMSYLDPPLLSVCIPRHITFLVKVGVYDNPIGFLFSRGWGAVPIERGGPRDLGAMKAALRALRQDRVIGLFPEGTRSRGQLQEAKPGVALLAVRSQAPVLPVAITGTEKSRALQGVLSYPHITVRIGQPFTLPKVEGRLTSDHLRSLTEMIMGRIVAMLPPRYHGVYTHLALKRPTAGVPF
jgi:1-acyl-sn-glycerol-3-phosphate acyltransferase